MKIKTLFLLSICLCLITGCKKDYILKLPITYQKGFGPFESSGGSIPLYNNDENNPWKNTFLKVTGIPKNWTDVKVGDINSDFHQYVYQNYHSGNISKEWYDELQIMWNWEPDTLNLSKEPIKCRAAFAIGNDSQGNTMVVVDANNNYDFSDDEPFELIQFDSELDWDSLANNEAIYVTFERLLNNKKIQFKVPLLISSVNMDQYYLLCSFAQYGTAKLGNHLISIHSFKFTNLTYKDVGITINQSLNGEKVDLQKVVFNNEYLEIENDLYKNLGVNRNKDVLLLEKMDLSKNQIRSTQIGNKPFDFSEKQFQKQNMISLDSLRGKYVLLEFWDTWCGPCIKEIPNLKTIYNKTDKSKFEIIGIVGNNQITVLEKFANKHGITWPQIIDSSNKIKEKYGVRGIPATFLINPEGIIIAKDLRGKELETKIDSLINKASR